MTTASAPDLIPSLLEEYGTVTRNTLARYLAPRPPERQLYDLVADYPQRGGRMLRPSLCIATARAFGAELGDAVHVAAALELLHNAFLVHDDVEDESETRRGRPTMHALHGVPIAVNVGDALALLGLRALMDGRTRLGPRLTMEVMEEAERMARESIEGQAIELGWRRDNVTALATDDYLQMVLKKTCWYTTIFPMRVGALIGARGEVPLDRFVRFGFFLGAAFQIRDDLLNLEGNPVRYGKELGGDLHEGKRTLMLIHVLRETAAAEQERLKQFLAAPRSARTAAEVRWVRRCMDAHGALEHARQTAHALAGAASHEFATLYADVPDSPDRRFIGGLPAWVRARA
jgi:geranylgeranyl diphosphate synthase type II